MVPLRFSHHWAFWNGLFRGLPGLWAYLTPSFLADIMGYVIFVGPLGGSANSDVVGFGGGLEGRPEIFAMDRNAEQAAPSTSTGLHIGAQQPPAHASTSTPVNQDERRDWDFLNEQPGMDGESGFPGRRTLRTLFTGSTSGQWGSVPYWKKAQGPALDKKPWWACFKGGSITPIDWNKKWNSNPPETFGPR